MHVCQCQKYHNKLLDFHVVIASENPDVIGITESWSHSDISDSEFQLADYELFRQDRPSNHRGRGGGVLLYANIQNRFGAKSTRILRVRYLLEYATDLHHHSE